jgi:hypothetical protein
MHRLTAAAAAIVLAQAAAGDLARPRLVPAAWAQAGAATYAPWLRIEGSAAEGAVSDPVWGTAPNRIVLRVRIARKTAGDGPETLSNLLYTDGRWRTVSAGRAVYRLAGGQAEGWLMALWPTSWKTATDEARLDLARQADGSWKGTFRVRAWGGVRWYFTQSFTLPAGQVEWL